MKKIILLGLVLSIGSCSVQKEMSKPMEMKLKNNCPEDGTCTLTVHQNKSLEIKSDELGNLYYSLEDHSGTAVIQYQYNRIVEEGLQDGHHQEEILFEIDKNEPLVSLSDETLQKTKMVFGRHCYCKGQTGFFKVTSGTLQLVNETDTLEFSLDFTVTEVPQLIKHISAASK